MNQRNAIHDNYQFAHIKKRILMTLRNDIQRVTADILNNDFSDEQLEAFSNSAIHIFKKQVKMLLQKENNKMVQYFDNISPYYPQNVYNQTPYQYPANIISSNMIPVYPIQANLQNQQIQQIPYSCFYQNETIKHRKVKSKSKIKNKIERVKNSNDLQQNNQNLQQNNQDSQQKNQDLKQSNQDLQHNNQDLQQGNQNLQQSNQNSQRNDQNLQQNNQNLQPTIQTTVAWQPQAQLEAIARNVQQQAQSTSIDKKTQPGFNSSKINNAGGFSWRNIHSKPCIDEWDIPKTDDSAPSFQSPPPIKAIDCFKFDKPPESDEYNPFLKNQFSMSNFHFPNESNFWGGK